MTTQTTDAVHCFIDLEAEVDDDTSESGSERKTRGPVRLAFSWIAHESCRHNERCVVHNIERVIYQNGGALFFVMTLFSREPRSVLFTDLPL